MASKTNKLSKTPVLDKHSRDLSKLAKEGLLDAVIGRDSEIKRVSQILSRRKKNNPILIGAPGCVLSKTKIIIKRISNDGNHNIIDR